jgi:YD repeat-containing protein
MQPGRLRLNGTEFRMVAIVSGNSLGISLTSYSTLGQQGTFGQATMGSTGERVFANVSNGNLVIQDIDDQLKSAGLDVSMLRTYNSQGAFEDDNADNWELGYLKKNGDLLQSGTVNTSGSTLTLTSPDGADAVYTWVAASNCYMSSTGAGALDKIEYNASTSTYKWTDGATGTTALYTKLSSGKWDLTSRTDATGNTTTYAYNNGLLTTVTSSSGESFTLTYGGGNKLSSITMNAADSSKTTRVTYTYNGNNLLSGVSVDLTPGNTSDSSTYTTTYSYDSSKRVSSIVQADGSRYDFTYDS